MKPCNCATTFSNTGTPSCMLAIKDTRKLIIVPTYGSDGSLNKIAAGDTLNQTYFDNKINAVDPLDRWYPLPLLKYVEDTKAENNYETPPDGSKIFVSEGIRSFKAAFMFTSITFLSNLKAFGCNKISVFEIDADTNLIGSTDGTDFYPRKVADQTFTSMLQKAKVKTEIGKIMIGFDIDETEEDEDLSIITSTEADCDFMLLNGLLDTNIAISGVGATAFTATMTLDFGTFKTKDPDVGHEKADFALDKSGTPVTITSVTESTDGVYTFVVPTCTGAHTLTFNKAGWAITTATVTFP